MQLTITPSQIDKNIEDQAVAFYTKQDSEQKFKRITPNDIKFPLIPRYSYEKLSTMLGQSFTAGVALSVVLALLMVIPLFFSLSILVLLSCLFVGVLLFALIIVYCVTYEGLQEICEKPTVLALEKWAKARYGITLPKGAIEEFISNERMSKDKMIFFIADDIAYALTTKGNIKVVPEEEALLVKELKQARKKLKKQRKLTNATVVKVAKQTKKMKKKVFSYPEASVITPDSEIEEIFI